VANYGLFSSADVRLLAHGYETTCRVTWLRPSCHPASDSEQKTNLFTKSIFWLFPGLDSIYLYSSCGGPSISLYYI